MGSELINSLFWIIAIWWLFSRMIRKINNVQHQKVLKINEELRNAHLDNQESEDKPDEAIEVEMVEDEICGKFIEKDQSYQLYYKDKVYYFCSWDCREKYINEHIKQSE